MAMGNSDESDSKFKEKMGMAEIMKLDEKEILAGILYQLRLQEKGDTLTNIFLELKRMERNQKAIMNYYKDGSTGQL